MNASDISAELRAAARLLEAAAEARMSAESALAAWPSAGQASSLLTEPWTALRHFADDADLHARDPAYLAAERSRLKSCAEDLLAAADRAGHPAATSEAQFIRDRCLGLIRTCSMHEEHWEMTILGRIHAEIASRIQLEADEHPIISFFAGAKDWTIYTTHRMMGASDGSIVIIPRDDFDDCDFGNFKQDLDSPRVTPATIRHAGKKSRFLYESGYASMAPIHYFKFWSLKWPVWRKTYALEMKQQGQSQRSTSPQPRSKGAARFIGAFFIAAGIYHFANPAPYLTMIPSYLPAPATLVAISGVAEMLGGIGVQLRATRVAAGWGLIALLLAIFPANLQVALHGWPGVDLPRWVLWARLPLQPVFIWLVYRYCVVRGRAG